MKDEFSVGMALALHKLELKVESLEKALKKSKKRVKKLEELQDSSVEVLSNHADAIEAIGTHLSPESPEDAEGVPMGFDTRGSRDKACK